LADGRVKYNDGDDKMSYSRTRYTTHGSGWVAGVNLGV
jgi:hypothetical protein